MITIPGYAECPDAAQQQPPSVTSEVVLDGLVHPWSVAFLPEGSILVAERPGRLRVFEKGTTEGKTIEGVPRLVNLFDAALDPNFADNSLIYLAYAARTADVVGLEVLRARLLENRLVEKAVIFEAVPKTRPMPLSGGRLLFDSEGALFVTVGNRLDGLAEEPESGSHLGTVVRLERPGSIFVGEARSGSGSDLVLTSGHRNVQGIAIDPASGEIWLAEHGPVGGDELNLLRNGGDYGWPIEHYGERAVEDAADQQVQGREFEKPVHVWNPAIAPSGLAVYRGSEFPDWHGSVFVGSLTGCYVLRVRLDKDKRILSEEKLLGELGERIRDVRVGPDQAVYVLTDEIDGKLVRIKPLPTGEI